MEPQSQPTYEVIVQVDPHTGETILPIPQELMTQMNWTDNTGFEFILADDGKSVVMMERK